MKILNMKMKCFILFILPLLVAGIAAAQVPTVRWKSTIGGRSNDSLCDIKATADGGFILAGKSKSNISGSKSSNAVGGFDFWVVKLASTGAVSWNKTFGGMADDVNPYIIQTPDGGYLLGGKSISNISGTKTEDAINFSYDYWVIKIDKNGLVQWDNTIGSIQLEAVKGLAFTPDDSGFFIAGYSHSNNGYDKTELNRGSSLWSDYWLVKVKRNGAIEWNKTYGGGNEDVLAGITATNDGGFIMGGYSYSPAEFEKTDSFLGNNDYWIVKIDAAGNRQWDKIYGGSLSDYLTSIKQTADGGYILGGYSNSPSSFNKTGPFRGGTDYWVVKTDAAGNQQWDKTIGGKGIDYLYSVQQTADGGYILGGTSNSNAGSGKTENSKGGNDIWIVKLNSSGLRVWDKTYGGSGNDALSSIIEIPGDGYVIGATSNSPASGDKSSGTVGGTGENDYWILRLNDGVSSKAVQAVNDIVSGDTKVNSAVIERRLSLKVSPNPVKDIAVISYSARNTNKLTLAIYDNNGKVMMRKTLANASGNYSADMTSYAAGDYHIVLSGGTSSATTSVVKIK